MRKNRILKLMVLIIFLGLFSYSCNEDQELVIKNITDNTIYLYVGDTYQIDYETSNVKDVVIFDCLDKDIVSVDEYGYIDALKEGSTEVYLSYKDNEEVINVVVSKKTYNITFIGFNNEILGVVETKDGEIPIIPTIPKIAGYSFMNWDKTISLATSDTTYTAIYNKMVNVTYELNGGTFTNVNKVIYAFVTGSSISLPSPVKAGYKFIGWTYTNNANDNNYVSKINSETDVTLYAKYEKKEEVDMIYNFNGGYTEQALCDNAISAGVPIFSIDNYNYNNGAYWSGRYAYDIFIGDVNNDPKATFSERIYIKYNNDYGLYEVVGHIASGGSTWMNNADYVITIGSGHSSYYSIKSMCTKLNIGDMVIFNGDFKQASKSNPIRVAFYPVGSECAEVSDTLKASDQFVTPTRLGCEFMGWYKADDTKVTSPSELIDGEVIYAHWKELNPVTDISINELPSKLYTSDTFQITASVVPSDAYFTKINYISSNTDVITISENGLIKALNKGTAIITICDYMKKKTITQNIEVVSKNTMTIRLSDGYKGMLEPKKSVNVTPTVYGEINNPSYTYKTSNPNVAVVDNGVITGVSEGLVDITIIENTSGISLTFGMTVRTNNNSNARVDKLLNLLIDSHFTTVEVGNFCLYNDGTQRVYTSTYGSVNLFTFAKYVQNKKYQEQARNCSASHKSRSGLGNIEFVTVHDTATLTGTADGIASYFSLGGDNSSIHYAVGNGEIFAVVPEEYVAFHAGDGTGTFFTWTKTNIQAPSTNQTPSYGVTYVNNNRYLTINGQTSNIALPGSLPLTILGPTWKVENGYYYIGGPFWSSNTYGYLGSRGGNNNSIGIEMCVNTSGDIYDTIQRTSQLVADILVRNGLDTSRVKMHNTWSGKNCPQVLIAGDYWDNFMKMVEVQYEVMKNYSDAEITFESLNKNYVNDDGRVIKYPETTMSVSYKITVKIGTESKSITLSSILPGSTCFEQLNGTYPASKIWNNGQFELDL